MADEQPEASIGPVEPPRAVIFANGPADELEPMTRVVPRALLPVFDKPLVYFPLSRLMEAGIRDVELVVNARELDQIRRALGDGSSWGIRLTYRLDEPDDSWLWLTLRSIVVGDPPAVLDCSTPEGLIEAATYVRLSQKLYARPVVDLEEIAYRRGWIDDVSKCTRGVDERSNRDDDRGGP